MSKDFAEEIVRLSQQINELYQHGKYKELMTGVAY